MKRHHKIGLATILMLVGSFVAALGIGYAALKRGLNAPLWVIEIVEERVNARLPEGVMAIGGARVELLDGLAPDVVLTDVVYLDAEGKSLAQVERLHAVFAQSPIFSPDVIPRKFALAGAKVFLQRDVDGAFNISFGEGNGFALSGEFLDIVTELKSLFSIDILKEVVDVSLDDLDLELVDDFSGKTWKVSDGALVMNLAGGQIDAISSFDLTRADSDPAQFAFSISAPKIGPAAQVTINVGNVEARDLAIQSPVLTWLSVLDAPISGALRTELLEDGSLGDLNGTLEIGAGALQPTEEARPIPFSEAKTYFSYDPGQTKIRFDVIEAKSSAGEILAEGFSYLQDWDGRRPQKMVTQLQFSNVVANPGNLLPEPAIFDGGALDFRLELDPFVATIGQLSLTAKDRHFLFDGEISAPDGHWDLSINTQLNTIDNDNLLALWPVKVAPRSRKWLKENVTGGRIFNVDAAVRKSPGSDLRASLGYEFKDAQVRYLKTLPPVVDGNGYVTLSDKTMTISVEEGQVVVPNSEPLDVSGTVITMPDVTLRPSPMQIDMKILGPIPTALALLDMEPFKLISKAGQTVEIAKGTAKVLASFQFDIVKKVKIEDVEYEVFGKLLDVTSERIVPSKITTSDELELHVTPKGMRISGPGRIGNGEVDVPFNVAWEQKFGKENKGRAKLNGDIELSQNFIDAFELGLPRSLLSGAGIAQIDFQIEPDQSPIFSLQSDLNRLGIRVPEIGWSSAKNANGKLIISGQLGDPAKIDNLELNVSGLRAKGRVDLSGNGQLNTAYFQEVRLGKGLNVQVRAKGRGRGAKPEISVEGGTVDLRSFKLPTGTGNGGAGAGGALKVRLDRLTLSNTMALTNFNGAFSGGGGFKGNYSGNINGSAPVTGTVAPTTGGTAIRMRSKDAGSVLQASGIYKNARNGVMDLVLAPRGQAGHYNGRMTATNMRIQNAPAMAELLGAISIVGAMEQLQESGILFNEVSADFILTPENLNLTKSSAIGASMGLSLSGIYDFSSRQISLRGVLSPLYLLNGIGSIFTRKGEGLFGFNFTVTGTADAPKTVVNPFSILTPGMFREIFNAPPPKFE